MNSSDDIDEDGEEIVVQAAESEAPKESARHRPSEKRSEGRRRRQRGPKLETQDDTAVADVPTDASTDIQENTTTAAAPTKEHERNAHLDSISAHHNANARFALLHECRKPWLEPKW